MTSSSNETLERIARAGACLRAVAPPPRPQAPEPAHAAGVVGIAVFVAALLVVTTVGSFDRTQPGASGVESTGPSATDVTVSPDTGWDGQGLPPEGAALSSPLEGEVIAEYAEIHVGHVYVYSDGRVIWKLGSLGYLADGVDPPETIKERRLTREGVELARSGALEPSAFGPPWTSLPADIWANEIRTYMPARYAVCYLDEEGNVIDPTGVVGVLPPRAEALLQGKGRTFDHSAGLTGDFPPVTCFEVTTDDARVLVGILAHAGFVQPEEGSLSFMPAEGQPVSITFDALLPQGEWVASGG